VGATYYDRHMGFRLIINVMPKEKGRKKEKAQREQAKGKKEKGGDPRAR